MVEIAGSIAGIVSTVLGVGKCFMYLFNYKSNLRNLEIEVGKLKVARGKVESKVEVASNNVEKIEETVEQWVIKVNSTVPEAETLIEERANVRCFDLKTRYKQSRKASKKVKDVAELLELQEAFGDQVSRPIIHEDPRLIVNKDYLAFQSRSSTLEDVLEALNEAEVDIIGVHGMGGIGKTTLVKEVGRQAKEDKRFDKVIFVVVTDTPNIEKIREEIADNLDLKLDDKKTETGKVNKLFARLKEEKTILIILDNIWVDLDLEKLGIPFGENHKGCKLLLTAREGNVLDRMGSKLFSIDVLKEDEAWRLFRKMTDNVDLRELQSLPNDVCKECGGLPIAILAVARALKNKRQRYQWENALQELRRPSPTEFKGVLKEVYSKIALSYNYLEGEELKKIFLLCSIMTYDASISNLFKFVMGLNILEGNNLTIEQARNRLYTLLDELKYSCLLLDCSSSERFSMHDVVRDIAITISYKDHHVLTERNDVEDEWENVDILKKCTKISLASSDIISKHWDEGLECPELEFFCMDMKDSSFKFPEKFFSAMTKLKVLSLNCFPSSISLPIGLQTLCLDGSKIGEVAIIGELKKLKILSLRGCYNIKQLPREICQLTQLRLLDLSNCYSLRVITPYVISNLVLLEELYMRGCSVLWEVGGPNVKRSNASLEELLHLSCLTALEIDIKDEKILPKGFFSKKLERYHISIGQLDGGQYLDGHNSTFGRRFMHPGSFGFNQHMRTIKMKLNSSICLEELQGIKNVEFLCLDELQNVKNGLQELDSNGFSQLKHLCVHGNPELLCLVDSTKCVTAFPLLESLILFNMINLEKICNGQPTTESFCNLKFIEVKGCDELTIVFSFSTAKSLPQLQGLGVEDCKNVKEIFATEREDNVNNDSDKIEFFQFRFLTLKRLPRLASFCSGMTTTSPSRHNGAEATPKFVFPRVTFLELDNLPEFRTFYLGRHTWGWPMLEELHVRNCKKVKSFTSECGSSNENNTEAQFDISEPALFVIEKINPDLKELIVDSLIPLGMLQRFNNLEKLNLDRSSDKVLFSCKEDCQLDPVLLFQNLTHLGVTGCNGILMNLIAPSVARSLLQLRELIISECDMIIEVVEDERDAAKDEIDFSKLKSLSLTRLKKLMCFYSGNYILKFPSLEELVVSRCPNMKTFSQGVLSTPKLQKVEERYWEWEEIRLDEMREEDLWDGNKEWWWEGDLNSTIQQIYKNNQCYPNSTALTLIGKDIKQICRGQIPNEHEFDDVKTLTIAKDKSTSIPVEILKTFHNLEILNLKASSYKELFSCGNDDKRAETFTQLQILQVLYCHNLTTLLPYPTSFENLTILEVQHCNGLRSLLTSSTAKSLVRLHRMTIQQCEMLTEVVTNEGDVEKDVVFRKLESLSLDCLENLTSFCSGNYTFQFLSLNRLIVHNCPKMETFSGGVLSTPELQKVEKDCYDWDLYVCWDYDLNTTIKQSQKMVVFPGMQGFELRSLKESEKLWDIQLPMSTSSSYRNITHLILEGFNNLKYVFPSSLVKSFEQLQQLEIRNCWVLKEIVTMEEVETTPKFVFSRVTFLKLENLPKLTTFYLGRHTSEWPLLKKLQVHDCEKVQIFTSECGSSNDNNTEAQFDISEPALFLIEKINPNLKVLIVDSMIPLEILQRFNKLEKLELDRSAVEVLSSCKEDCKLDPVLLFQNLTHLGVTGCNGILMNLLAPSVARSLLQLREMTISTCDMIIEVVDDERDAEKDEIDFPKLKSLSLICLENLVCFYFGNCILKFPSLEKLHVSRCSNMKTFSQGVLSTPKLQKVNSELYDEGCWEGDLNSTIQQLYKNNQINPNLEALRVSEIDSVMTWQGPFSENFFCKLKRLEIIFNKSASVPVGILQRFKNLEMLKLHQIQSIELFFCGEDEKTIGMPTHIKGLELGDCYDLEYLWKQDSKVPFVLQNLEVLEVYWCRKLINVGPSSASFQNLKVLTVSDCWDMVNLITSSAAKCLVQLTEMEIHRCNKLIEIVENDQDGAEYEIIFTKLKWLSLENLQSLTCFCTGKYTFKFPTLEELIVKNCTNMKTFCEGVLSTPRLQKVWEDKCLNIGSCSEGELNTIIQQLHKNVVDKRKSKQIFQLN